MVYLKIISIWVLLMTITLAQDIVLDESTGRNCFGGIMSYEKTSGVTFKVPPSQVLIAGSDQAVTPDCASLCRQSNSCIAYTIEYKSGRCQAFDRDSVGRRELLRPQIGTNYLEEVCYRGVSNYSNICGNRIWAFERILGAVLEGFDDKEEKNVASKVDCERICLNEKSFICRSAEYDEIRQLCRLSREDRRTQPLAFKLTPASSIDYLENQCLKPTPACRYELKSGVSVLSLDDLQYASSTNECERTCDQTHLFSCWAYSFDNRQSRCYLSGDDTAGPSADGLSLPLRPGFIYGERKCISDPCSNGVMTFEKISANTLRSAQPEPIAINTVGQGVTLDCLQGCKDLGPQCPAMLVDYSTNKCMRLDRNSQGRDSDIIPFPTHSYFEQICLRGNTQACHGKAWAFERVVRHELLGFDHRVIGATQSRRECEEACLQEAGFVCRSAEYDYGSTECRLSKEDRRSRPAAFGPTTRNVDYLENQCLGADLNCRLEKKEYTAPALVEFVQNQVRTEEECLTTCASFRGFPCRTVGFRPNTGECLISSDDHASAYKVFSEPHPETLLFERTCLMSRSGGTSGGQPIPENNFVAIPPPLPTGDPDNDLPTPQASSYLGGRCPSSAQGFIEYEKITGHVLKVDLMSTLIDNGDRKGITKECKDLCDLDTDCLAFNLDYNSSECISLRRDSTLNRHDLEMTEATGYFEPVCFRSRGCGRLWTFERHLNMDLRGQSKDVIQSVTKAECQERCLFEVRFPCRSALYNHVTSECRLSKEDRFSKPDSFVKASDIDYLENQCSNILTARHASTCQYAVMARDRVLSFVDRVVQTANEPECQRACDSELQFVCRSYSFTGTQGTRSPDCYLSADTRNSVGAQLQTYPGATYAERICPAPPTAMPPGIGPPIPGIPPPMKGGPVPQPGPYPGYIPPPGKQPSSLPGPFPGSPPVSFPTSGGGYPGTYPSGPGTQQGLYPSPTGVVPSIYPPPPYPGSPVSNVLPKGGTGQGSSGSYPGYPGYNAPTYPGSGSQGPYPGQPANFPGQPANYPGQQSGYPMQSAKYPPQTNGYPSGQTSNFNGQSGGYPGQAGNFLGQPPTYPGVQSTNYLGQTGQYPGQPPVYPGQPPVYQGQPSYNGNVGSPTANFPVQYPGTYPAGGQVAARCDFTGDAIYEKTMGFAIRPLGRMEPLPASVTSQHMVSDCLRSCTQDGARCQAFMIQYPFSPSATPCLSLDRGLGLERSQLLPRGDTAYFEKVCLRGKGCAKMWTFERVVGFQLDGSYDKELRNIMTKEDCEDACLAESTLPCRSASFIYSLQLCRMTSETRRTKPESFRYVGNDVDYLENQCAPEPSECEFTDLTNKFNPFTDRLSVRVLTMDECKKSCEQEQEFICRSMSFDSTTNDCYLSAEDRFSTPAGPNIMIDRPGFSYGEKGGCGQVKVDCTQTEMLVTLRFGAPFSGRIYAKGNPQLCFLPGNTQTQVTMNIPIGTQCGTVEESQGRYANEIVIQQHPVIMTDHDKTYRVVCSFDMADKTLTFSPGGGGAIDVTYGIPRLGAPPPLITNTAPTPNVRLRITDRSGSDVSAVNLGDELFFRIEPDPYSAFGVFAKNLVAKSEFLDYLPLLDISGCPTDPNVFPSLEMERGTRALVAPFKAFRFASTGRVNFEVQIQFCQDACQSGRCQYGTTFGRKKRNDVHPADVQNRGANEATPDDIILTSNTGHMVSATFDIVATTATNSEPHIESTNTKEADNVTIVPEVVGTPLPLHAGPAVTEHTEAVQGRSLTRPKPEVPNEDPPPSIIVYSHPLPVRAPKINATGNPVTFPGTATPTTGRPNAAFNFRHPASQDVKPFNHQQGRGSFPDDRNPGANIPIMPAMPSTVAAANGFRVPDGYYNWNQQQQQQQQQQRPFQWSYSPYYQSNTQQRDVAAPSTPSSLAQAPRAMLNVALGPKIVPTSPTPSGGEAVTKSSMKMNVLPLELGDIEEEPDDDSNLIPSEIPLRLSLTVNDDLDSERRAHPVPVSDGKTLNQNYQNDRSGVNTQTDVDQIQPDTICSPKSTVIASVACIVLIHLAVVCGATIWCRRRFRAQRLKEESLSPLEPASVMPSAGTMSCTAGASGISQHPVFYRSNTAAPSQSSTTSSSSSSGLNFRNIDFYNRFPNNSRHQSPISMNPSHWMTESRLNSAARRSTTDLLDSSD